MDVRVSPSSSPPPDLASSPEAFVPRPRAVEALWRAEQELDTGAATDDLPAPPYDAPQGTHGADPSSYMLQTPADIAFTAMAAWARELPNVRDKFNDVTLMHAQACWHDLRAACVSHSSQDPRIGQQIALRATHNIEKLSRHLRAQAPQASVSLFASPPGGAGAEMLQRLVQRLLAEMQPKLRSEATLPSPPSAYPRPLAIQLAPMFMAGLTVSRYLERGDITVNGGRELLEAIRETTEAILCSTHRAPPNIVEVAPPSISALHEQNERVRALIESLLPDRRRFFSIDDVEKMALLLRQLDTSTSLPDEEKRQKRASIGESLTQLETDLRRLQRYPRASCLSRSASSVAMALDSAA